MGQVDTQVMGEPPNDRREGLELLVVRYNWQRAISAGGAVRADQGEGSADRHTLADRHEQLVDHSRLEDLYVDVGLVGVDDGDDVAAVHVGRRA